MAFSRLAKAHVAGESKLAPDARGSPANGRDRHDRGAAQARQHIGQRLQAGLAGRQGGRVLGLGEEIIVGEKEPLDHAVEDHHLHVRIAFERLDDLFQLRIVVGPKMFRGG